MRTSLIRLASLLCVSFVFSAPPGHAADTDFSGTLEILASVGLSPDSIQLLSVPVSGTADISGTVIRIGAGEISAVIPPAADFGGTLINGAATFSAGGAGPGSTCPAAAWNIYVADRSSRGSPLAFHEPTPIARLVQRDGE